MPNTKKNATAAKKNTTSKKASRRTRAKNAAKRMFFEPTMKIVKLCKGNPRREGSHGYNSMAVVRSGMTVEQFVKKGGRLRDLHWDVQHNNVELA